MLNAVRVGEEGEDFFDGGGDNAREAGGDRPHYPASALRKFWMVRSRRRSGKRRGRSFARASAPGEGGWHTTCMVAPVGLAAKASWKKDFQTARAPPST